MRRSTPGEESPSPREGQRRRTAAAASRAARRNVASSGAVAHRRTRNAAATRAAILDAAERLFAEKGYRATSLEEIGHVAGFSRGTPGYFFGAKRELYAAVVDRILRRAEAFFPDREEVAPLSLGTAVTDVVSRYLDFLASEPTFVRLMHAEGVDVPNAASAQALEIARGELERVGIRGDDSAHLALSVVALCCFPLTHAETVAGVLGVDMRSPAAIDAHKRYVAEILAARAGTLLDP